MKKKEKIAVVREWLAEFPEMEVPVMVEKVMNEFEVSEKTAHGYINDASKPEGKSHLAIAKGYESPFTDEQIEAHVDFESEDYAVIEIEKREFNISNGKKISYPRLVHFNRSDFITFLKTEKGEVVNEKTGKKEVVELCEGRDIHGQVNVVWHIPKKWNIAVKCDEWQ